MRVSALIVVAAACTIWANAVTGGEPSNPTPIPDSAFRAVTVPSGIPVPAAPASPRATPDLPILFEPNSPVPPPARPQPSVGTPKAIVQRVPPPTTHVLRGAASWYCSAGGSPCTSGYPDGPGFDAYAAAGPKLRAAIGSSWRGTIVYVDGIRVKLIDWCQCYKGEPQEKLLDLYHDVYLRTGGSVAIRW